MPKIAYRDMNFKDGTLATIASANKIIREYREMGFSLTLRQLYYQFVSRDLIANKQSEYKRLGSIINDGRLAGLIDWSAIEDRTRSLRTFPSWSSPDEILESAFNSYAENPWLDQPTYVEAWIEKDALLGVLESACERRRVPYFSCRGYVSQSEMWAAPQRMIRAHQRGQRCHVLHLGDHDPSGVDMSRDIAARLDEFSEREGFSVTVHRLALNMTQVEQFSPPPNPAKITDSRAAGYISEYGRSSWELDALEPQTISEIVNSAIDSLIDADVWSESMANERESKSVLRTAIDNAKGGGQ